VVGLPDRAADRRRTSNHHLRPPPAQGRHSPR